MGVRQEFVKQMQNLLGKNKFRYGAFKSQPDTPYALYVRNYSNNIICDDAVYCKVNKYDVGLVTSEKDFDLEEKVEKIFDDLGIVYDVFNDEDIQDEKVHIVEWEFELYE